MLFVVHQIWRHTFQRLSFLQNILKCFLGSSRFVLVNVRWAFATLLVSSGFSLGLYHGNHFAQPLSCWTMKYEFNRMNCESSKFGDRSLLKDSPAFHIFFICGLWFWLLLWRVKVLEMVFLLFLDWYMSITSVLICSWVHLDWSMESL